MTCPICKQAHQTQQCKTFITAVQPLKDLINGVYAQLPALVRSGHYPETWDAIYDNFYSPTPQNLPLNEYGWVYYRGRCNALPGFLTLGCKDKKRAVRMTALLPKNARASGIARN